MFSISFWFEWVASEWNCADAPSRNIEIPFTTRRDCPFNSLEGFYRFRGGGDFSDSFAMSPRSGSDSAPTEIDDGKAISSIDYDGMIVREGEHA